MRSELAIEPLVVEYGAATLPVFGERTVSSRRRRSIDGEAGVHMDVIGAGVLMTAPGLLAADR
jgi:hypothetical protein